MSAVSDQHSPVLVLMAGVGCCASRSADGKGVDVVPVVVLMAGMFQS